MTTKYGFVDGDTVQAADGRILRRIRALVDLPLRHVVAGQLGGYVESDANLSHEGQAWIAGQAFSYGGARVTEDALLSGRAWAYGDAILRGLAVVGGSAQMRDQAAAFDDCRIDGNACLFGDATVRGDALVSDDVMLPSGAHIYARDLVRFFRVTDRERGAYPVTLYNDSSDRTMVVTDDFAGPVEKYRAERLSGVARGSGDAMYLVMVDMGCKRIDAARAAYKRRQRRAA